MPAPTFMQWFWIVGIDGAVLASAGAIAFALFRARHRLFAVLTPLPFLVPIGLGLWALHAEMDEEACQPDEWFCFTPVFVHWAMWVVGWVIALVLLTVLGFFAVVFGWAAPAGFRFLRKQRASAPQ